jgi:hypothetical protein
MRIRIKLLSVSAAVALAAALVGCGDPGNAGSGSDGSPATSSKTATLAFADLAAVAGWAVVVTIDVRWGCHISWFCGWGQPVELHAPSHGAARLVSGHEHEAVAFALDPFDLASGTERLRAKVRR